MHQRLRIAITTSMFLGLIALATPALAQEPADQRPHQPISTNPEIAARIPVASEQATPAGASLDRDPASPAPRKRPPLDAERVTGEVTTGVGMGVLVAAGGALVGGAISSTVDCPECLLPSSDLDIIVGGILGAAVAYPLGVGLGVGWIGRRGDQTGSYGAAIGGAYLGAMLGVVPGLATENGWATLAGLLAGAPLGAAIGFNMTRDYDHRGAGLVNVSGGDARLSIPAVSVTPDPLRPRGAVTSLRLVDGRF